MSTPAFTGFAVFDLETTGFSPAKHHRIIEIGIVRLDEDFEVVEEWETLINPDRDVSASQIHGLTASDLADAPTFGQLLADIWHRFEGAIPVAHNFTFDRNFIKAEFARHGVDLSDFDGLCTMRLSNSYGLCPGKRRLLDVCKALKLEVGENHSAGNDAKMCASILRRLADFADLASMSPPVSCQELWKRQATPLGITRQKARSKPVQSPLELLLERLPQLSTTDSPSIDEYLLVLDRILEDRVIEEDEVDEIASIAAELGLSTDDITQIHEQYISNLVGLVLSDGIVTEDERRDLSRVAGLLGIDQSKVEELLSERPMGEFSQTEDLSGKTVCFTGELRCKIDGDFIDKNQAEAIAEKYGLIPKPSVTKNLDILVVADPDTQSGKAKKARQYGIRIMAERAFWHKLGIAAE